MRKMNYDALLVCKLQGMAFEASLDKLSWDSYTFIERYMFSEFTKEDMDTDRIMLINETENSMVDHIKEEYKNKRRPRGRSDFTKYGREEMFWMGYIYRYMAYINQISSQQCFRIIKPNELRGLYLPYHSLDCENAINRILEEKGYDFTPEGLNRRAMEIYREIFKERRERENKEKITIISNKLS